jgi:hypothetical protein
MALGDDVTLFVIGRDAIRAVPCTVLTSDTAGIIMKNDTVIEFDVAIRWASDEACGVNTVVTTHGVKQQQGVREAPSLHLTYTTPFDVSWVVILLITRNFATATTDTFSRIEVKSVLFSLFEWWNINGIVTALHSRIGLVADEGFQGCRGVIHIIVHYLVFSIQRRSR